MVETIYGRKMKSNERGNQIEVMKTVKQVEKSADALKKWAMILKWAKIKIEAITPTDCYDGRKGKSNR